jgi:hypothetical protein
LALARSGRALYGFGMPTPNHIPAFSFRTHGGSCLGERWIYDGETPIARFTDATVDEPHRELLYFGDCARPLLLTDVRLRPDQRPLFGSVPLYWRVGGRGGVCTTELQQLSVAGDNTAELTLTLVADDPAGALSSERLLRLTWDGDTGSYIYDFDCRLTFREPPQADASGCVRLEYTDPMYADLPAPSQRFPGMWRKPAHTHFLAEQPDGSVWQLPINHNATRAEPCTGPLAPDGWFITAYEPGANAGIQLVGETAGRTGIGICHWGYDIHLCSTLAADAWADGASARFRLRLCPDATAQALMARRNERPPIVYRGLTALPCYERRSGFASGIDLREPTPGDTDPYLWEPEEGMEAGATWCRNHGRSDDCSLKIARTTPGISRWIMRYEGQGSFCGHWTRAIGYRISVWIQTADLQGGGAVIGVAWQRFHGDDTDFPAVLSTPVTGTQDWTRVEVVLAGPPPADVHDILFYLQADGIGTAWFDDLDVVQTTG